MLRTILGLIVAGAALAVMVPNVGGVANFMGELFIGETFDATESQDRPLIDVEETTSDIMKAAYQIDTFFIQNPTAERQDFRVGDGFVESSKDKGLVPLETSLEALAKKEKLSPVTVTFNADYRGFKIVVPNAANSSSPEILYDSIDGDLNRE